MAKSSTASAKVNVLFDPDENCVPLPLALDIIPGSDRGTNCWIKECTHKGFNFSYFDKTLEEGATLIAVPMILPGFFKEVGQDVRKLFLLRTGITEKECRVNKRYEFYIDMLSKGAQGCPIPILLRPGESESAKKGKKYSRNYFTFNGMRFYPFLMREHTVGYYVCDEGATKYHWPKFHPKDPGIALDYPVVYDATLGLFLTRGATYIAHKP